MVRLRSSFFLSFFFTLLSTPILSRFGAIVQMGPLFCGPCYLPMAGHVRLGIACAHPHMQHASAQPIPSLVGPAVDKWQGSQGKARCVLFAAKVRTLPYPPLCFPLTIWRTSATLSVRQTLSSSSSSLSPKGRGTTKRQRRCLAAHALLQRAAAA